MNKFDIYKCSKRLRELRTSRKASHSKLADEIGVSEQLLKNYEQAYLNKGIPTNTMSDKTEAIAGMSIKTLYKLAKLFNVSTDYIIGLSDVPTNNPNIDSTSKLTGLTVDAINNLIWLKEISDGIANREKGIYTPIDVFNIILSKAFKTHLLMLLETMTDLPKQFELSLSVDINNLNEIARTKYLKDGSVLLGLIGAYEFTKSSAANLFSEIIKNIGPITIGKTK